MMQSLEYLETCSRIVHDEQRNVVYQQIRRFKQRPAACYLQMARVFLNYKNGQVARLILQDIVLKGYNLTE